MSTNLSPSKISTRIRSPTFTVTSASAAPSVSSGTSRINFTGGRLFFARCPCAGLVSRDSFTNSTRPICAASEPSRVADLCCVITQGPACNTVTGRTSPLESNNCVIPTFFPKMPVTRVAISISIQLGSLLDCNVYWLAVQSSRLKAHRSKLFMFLPECLDLHIHARRQIELHQRIHRLLRRLENVEQALVRAYLKLLPRLLIHVRRTQHAVLVLHGGQGNRPGNLRARALGRIHNLARRLIQNAIVVSLQPYANSFFSNHSFTLSASRPSGKKYLAAGSKPRIGFSFEPRASSKRERFCFLLAARSSGLATPYCTISAIVPAPTVCPPSRMAKRKPFSMATGVISSITRLTLSPGITISVPAGSSATPVTSVVRR